MTSDERKQRIDKISDLVSRMEHGQNFFAEDDDISLVLSALNTYSTVLKMVEGYEHEKN